MTERRKNMLNNAEEIRLGRCCLGIELGSTRIKAVLINKEGEVVAQGNFDWENDYVDGVWTYPLEKAVKGTQSAYARLKEDVKEKYGETVKKLCSAGISAMMHGYIAFDKQGNQLGNFRTWRNTITEEAADALTELFSFNIPQRWSIAHLQQAIMNGEKGVDSVDYLTTLSGYIHYLLTDKRVLGADDASGMFPIDSEKLGYNEKMLEKFDEYNKGKLNKKLKDILPCVLAAGENAGTLTADGARLLDPDGDLIPGVPMCPPEGDAGTGMVATNSVDYRTGNISAGTSIFSMTVLEKPLSKMYREIDMVTTPDGKDVAMVHCNNCTGDIDAWVRVLGETLCAFGVDVKKGALYDKFYELALNAEKDCGGVVSYNFFSGEPVIGVPAGRPMTVRTPDAKLSLSNLARSLVYSSFATLKLGMDILTVDEKVKIDIMLGHGGLFKTPVVGQKLLASALGFPVAVMPTAAEGGAWGIAVLALYMADKKDGETLGDFLNTRIFASNEKTVIAPDKEDAAGFDKYLNRYSAGLAAHAGAAKIN